MSSVVSWTESGDSLAALFYFIFYPVYFFETLTTQGFTANSLFGFAR